MLKNAHARFAACVFGSALVLFGLQASAPWTSRRPPTGSTPSWPPWSPPALRSEEVARREDLMAASIVVDVALGEKVFTERCTACHQFDRKVVGPPYNEVLPKYKDRLGDLEAFIRKPVKVILPIRRCPPWASRWGGQIGGEVPHGAPGGPAMKKA